MSITKNKKDKILITRIRKMKTAKLKGVNTLKYCGIIQLKEDALVIQKRLRDEWK